MIRSLSQKEFISDYGERRYMAMCRATYNHMKELDAYKKCSGLSMLCMVAYDWEFNDGRKGIIIIEATIHKIATKKQDFGLISIKITDEEMPDEILDRYNDIKNGYISRV